MTSDASSKPDPILTALLENRRAFLRFLERRVGSKEAAEDLFQEAFARALAKRDTIRKDESAVAWFYRMLRNAIVDLYRHRASTQRALESFSKELDVLQPGTETHEAVCRCVSRLASTLKPEYAAALHEVDIEGAAVKTFGSRHGISAGNAAVRVHRARQALRKQVVATCGACATHGCLDCRCRQPHA